MYVIYFDVVTPEYWEHLSVAVNATVNLDAARVVWDRLKDGGFEMVSARP